MIKSTEINELAAALAAAQAEMTGAHKDAKNPHFRSDYSTLASVIGALRGPLSRNDLSHSSLPGNYIDGCVQVTTILMHKSGQFLSTMSTWPIGNKVNPQTVSSAVTYAKRVNLCAIAGLESTDDDDGNAASAAESASQPAQATPVPLTDNQVATLKTLLGELPGEVTVNFLRALNAENVEAVPAARYDWACTALRRKIADAAKDSA